ncbi:hypothetical protein LGADH_02060 [Lactobacillus paragasseri]|nr:hypothetical protein [Lactobacillus paragasseri]
MVNILQKGFNHVGLRKHLFDAFVWYICVSFANLYRPPQKNKNAALPITLASYRASFSSS